MQPAVFLDRDNTIILNDGDLGDPAGVRVGSGVAAGLKALREAGFRLVVVTNQGGVARGKYSEADVDAVHQRIAHLVDEEAGRAGLIDRFYYCPYHPKALVPEYRRDHPWRKPHPGMLLQAARDMGLDLAHSWLIGDQERDIAAGRSAGCRTVMLHHSNGKQAEENSGAGTQPTTTVASFSEAVQTILKHAPPNARGFGDERSAEARRVRRADPSAVGHTAEPSDGTDHAAPQRTLPGVPPAERAGGPIAANGDQTDLGSLKRAVRELAEEIRSDRLRRSEFTAMRLLAAFGQLMAILLALLGVLQMDNLEIFAKWMAGAALIQLITITVLVLDLKG